MFRKLPITLFVLVIAEFASIIWVGRHVGVIATLCLIILGGLAGGSVITSGGSGLKAVMRSPPPDLHFASHEAASRFLVLLAGLLLILPGFLSDMAALVLLLPPVRRVLAAHLAAKVKVHTAAWRQPEARRPGPLVIEGEAVELDSAPPPGC